MWPRCRRAFHLLTGLVVLSGIIYGSVRSVAAQDGSAWLVSAAPTLSKVVELPAGTPPDSSDTDCAQQTFLAADKVTPQMACMFLSPLGVLAADGRIQSGSNQLLPLHGSDKESFFIPTVDPSMALLSINGPGSGNYIGVYRSLTKAALQLDYTTGDYGVNVEPDFRLHDQSTREPLMVDTAHVAFSTDGVWMVVNVPHRGLLRVSMEDFSTKLFAPPIEPTWFSGFSSPSLAISNDGRYVAANTDIFNAQSLNLYDLSTCSDQLDVAVASARYCVAKDLWHGTDLTNQAPGQGLLAQQADMTYPVHLRFINDYSISFSARYSGGSTYKAATFVATAPGVTQHQLGLLGVGDSYISGQGTFTYREGTDTANDPCHLSELSYPLILGKQDFNSYNSVACSGALTSNVAGSSGNYMGQVKDGLKEDQRNKPNILANFQPGYIYQQEFASTYQPEAMLLSIGGNDIGFVDILKSCVKNEGGGTCYNTYEDRAELVNEIDATYSKLVSTYVTLREQSGGARLYVVGYPQIAKPGGDCDLNVRLNSDELEFSAQLISYLDGVIQQAAATAGVVYVDTQHALDGHRLCEPGAKAVNGLTAGNDTGLTLFGHTINLIGTESYHPTVLGHQLLAQAIAKQTLNLTAAMPTPKPYAVPVFDPNASILQTVPHTGRHINWVTNDDTMADDLVLRGDAQQVTVNGAEVQLQPGSKYQIVLHSTPVLLAEGGVNADGNISTTVHIPADIEPGYHVLHVYGQNMAGEDVDVQETLYVGANADDYNGDGVPNTANSCLLVAPSGQDADHDGVDDACDPVIAAAQTNVTGAVTVDESIASPTEPSVSADAENNTSLAVAAVLGDSATGDAQTTSSGTSTPLQITPSAQKLYSLDWSLVLKVGLACTTSLAALYACRRRD